MIERTDSEKQRFGKYEIINKLGSGGMAVVFKAKDPDDNRLVALKVLHAFLVDNEDISNRFRQEADVMAHLDHPNIVKLYTFDANEQGIYYLVMEYIAGEALNERINASSEKGEMLPLTEIVDVMTAVSGAVDYAHSQHLVHRDIKPANVMIETNGRVVLMDFGIVKLLNQSVALTATGSILGTPAYLSPEMALGDVGDERSDIYSLGVMFYQMITGKLPFNADTPMGIIMKAVSEPTPLPGKLRPETPLQIHEIIHKAMVKEPENRYQSAQELIAALSAVNLADVSETAPIEIEQLPDFDVLSLPDAESLVPPFQIPKPLADFSGRRQILQTLNKKLTEEDNRIVSLVGLGGVGKTAVAIQAIQELQPSFPDGILWANLDYTTPEEELVHFADAFGHGETMSRKYTLQQKRDYLHTILAGKSVLIVIDQAKDMEQIKWLLPDDPQNVCLITTRNGKMLIDLKAEIIPIPAFTEQESLAYLRHALGHERYRQERDVARSMVKLVGGLPLALSIIAGFVQETEDLSLAEYETLLLDEQTRLANLTDWEDATRDIAASFELSYQALPPPLQALFVSLSVFDGPDFAARDVAIITQTPPAQVKIGLARLHALSLIGAGLGERESRLPVQLADAGRYRINPLLRLFAREKAAARVQQLRIRAVDYFANLAHLNEAPAGYPRLDLEWKNVVGALQWAFRKQQLGAVKMGVVALTKTSLGIVGFMDARGHWSAARELLDRALPAVDVQGDKLVAIQLRSRAGAFALKQSDWDVAEAHLQVSQSLLESVDSRDVTFALEWAYLCDFQHRLALRTSQQAALRWIDRGLALLADFVEDTAVYEHAYLSVLRAGVLVKLGRLQDALAAAEAGLAGLPEEATSARVGGLINLGTAHYLLGNLEASIGAFEDALPQAQALGDFRRLATTAMNLGILQEQLGQFDLAITNYEKALQLHQALGHADDTGSAHINLGSIYTKLGDDELAAENLQTAVSIAQQAKLSELEAFAHVGLADLYVYAEDTPRANTHLVLAEAICQQSEATFSFLLPIVVRLQAEVALQLGDLPAANTYLDRALSLAENDDFLMEQGICWRVRGQILAVQLDKTAFAAFKRSIDLLAEQSPYEQAKSQLAFAEYLLTLDGETAVAKAQQNLTAANEIFLKLNANREQQKARIMLNLF